MMETPNHRNSVVKPLGRLNSGGTSSPRATATGSAWVHAPSQENPSNGGICNDFLHSSFSRRWWQTPLPTKEETQQAADLFSVLDQLLFCLLSVVLFFFFRWRICRGAWSDSPATHTVAYLLDLVDCWPHFLLWLTVRPTKV